MDEGPETQFFQTFYVLFGRTTLEIACESATIKEIQGEVMTKPFRWDVPAEKDIESAILYFLNYQLGCFAFKVETQARFDPRLGIYRQMNKHVLAGTPDILCCLSVHGMGVFIAFEVKAENGRQSKQQKDFQERLQDRASGFYFIVRSVKEAENALQMVIANVSERIVNASKGIQKRF